MNHHASVIKPDFTFTKLGFAKTSANGIFIDRATIFILKDCFYGIEIAIAPWPEMRMMKYSLCIDRRSLSGLKGIFLALEMSNFFTIRIKYFTGIDKGSSLRILVSYLAFCMYRYLFACRVVVGTIDIYPSSTQITI